MKALRDIFNEYDYNRELEVCYDKYNNRILIYKYIPHTKDEEGGDFIADFELAEFETEFEKKFGYIPEVMKDYDGI